MNLRKKIGKTTELRQFEERVAGCYEESGVDARNVFVAPIDDEFLDYFEKIQQDSDASRCQEDILAEA